MNGLSLLQALIFEPKKAFTELDARPRILFPLLVLLISSAGFAIWYSQVVDHEWMVDQQLRTAREQLKDTAFAPPMTDAQIEARAKSAAEHVTRSTVVSAIGVGLALVIFRLLEALYYMLAGKMSSVSRSYRHWLSLACWSSLPSVLAVIPAAVALATATTAQIDQASLQVLSLNSLFFHRTPAESGYTLLNFLNLPQFVGVFLAAYGVRVWSGRSWLHGILFAGLPLLLLCGLTIAIMGRA